MTELFYIIDSLNRIEKKLDNKFNNRWVDLKAACVHCDLSASTLMRNIRSNRLKCSKTGGKLMFKIEWLDKWIEGWSVNLMFNTYLWHEVRGDNWWRIQTNDPRVIRKLRRRKTASLCLWCINDSIVVFRTQYYSAKEAKKSLHRLTG